MGGSVAPIQNVGECANILVTTAAGRKYNLGKPTSRLFRLRRALYIRAEGLKQDEHGEWYSTKEKR